MRKLSYTVAPENDYKKAGIVVVPIPYDETSTWMKGADKGPMALFEASEKLELYDIETNSEVYKKGIFTDKPVHEKSSPKKMVSEVEKAIARHLKNGKFVVSLGGEHSISIGVVKAFSKFHKKFTVLQLDAHSDLRNEYYDSKFNHGCVMARVRELAPIVQVGIRSMGAEEKKNMKKENVFFAHNIYNNKKWADRAIAKLQKKVYITIDLDVFDPSIMPSTGTPEPGGLLWYDVIEFIKKVAAKREIIGFDVVELCPNPENKAPDFLAAKLIYTILSYKWHKS